MCGLTTQRTDYIIEVSNDTLEAVGLAVASNARIESEIEVKAYMQTVKDLRFPKRSEMREFGKVYNGKDDVYIKIRVELLGVYGQATTFVMSFHFAEKAFTPEMFPYRKK